MKTLKRKHARYVGVFTAAALLIAALSCGDV